MINIFIINSMNTFIQYNMNGFINILSTSNALYTRPPTYSIMFLKKPLNQNVTIKNFFEFFKI